MVSGWIALGVVVFLGTAVVAVLVGMVPAVIQRRRLADRFATRRVVAAQMHQDFSHGLGTTVSLVTDRVSLEIWADRGGLTELAHIDASAIVDVTLVQKPRGIMPPITALQLTSVQDSVSVSQTFVLRSRRLGGLLLAGRSETAAYAAFVRSLPLPATVATSERVASVGVLHTV